MIHRNSIYNAPLSLVDVTVADELFDDGLHLLLQPLNGVEIGGSPDVLDPVDTVFLMDERLYESDTLLGLKMGEVACTDEGWRDDFV